MTNIQFGHVTHEQMSFDLVISPSQHYFRHVGTPLREMERIEECDRLKGPNTHPNFILPTNNGN